jgi:hypothetical protein
MNYAERLARKRVKLSGGRMLTSLSVKSNLRKSCLALGLNPSWLRTPITMPSILGEGYLPSSTSA